MKIRLGVFIQIILTFYIIATSKLKGRFYKKNKDVYCGTIGNLIGKTNFTGSPHHIMGTIAHYLGTDTEKKYVKKTCYSHKGSLNQNYDGTLFSDSSCFASYIIQHTNFNHFNDLFMHAPNVDGIITASCFQKFFSSIEKPGRKSDFWSAITDVRDLRQGDFIAWSHDYTKGNTIKEKEDGHVMLVINGPDSDSAVFTSLRSSHPLQSYSAPNPKNEKNNPNAYDEATKSNTSSNHASHQIKPGSNIIPKILNSENVNDVGTHTNKEHASTSPTTNEALKASSIGKYDITNDKNPGNQFKQDSHNLKEETLIKTTNMKHLNPEATSLITGTINQSEDRRPKENQKIITHTDSDNAHTSKTSSEINNPPVEIIPLTVQGHPLEQSNSQTQEASHQINTHNHSVSPISEASSNTPIISHTKTLPPQNIDRTGQDDIHSHLQAQSSKVSEDKQTYNKDKSVNISNNSVKGDPETALKKNTSITESSKSVTNSGNQPDNQNIKSNKKTSSNENITKSEKPNIVNNENAKSANNGIPLKSDTQSPEKMENSNNKSAESLGKFRNSSNENNKSASNDIISLKNKKESSMRKDLSGNNEISADNGKNSASNNNGNSANNSNNLGNSKNNSDNNNLNVNSNTSEDNGKNSASNNNGNSDNNSNNVAKSKNNSSRNDSPRSNIPDSCIDKSTPASEVFSDTAPVFYFIYVADSSDTEHYNNSGPRITKGVYCLDRKSTTDPIMIQANDYDKYQTQESHHTGVGSGQIIIVADAHGKPIGFQMGCKEPLIKAKISMGRARNKIE